MLEESIITVAWNSEYEWAFDLCFDELEDPYFAEEVCESVFSIHRDDSIYFVLFQVMMKNDFTS